MVKLEIINKKEGLYYLKDSKNNNYEFSMEFYDIDESPKIGDYLELSAELLNPMYSVYSTLYAFGNLENPCGRLSKIVRLPRSSLLVTNSPFCLL